MNNPHLQSVREEYPNANIGALVWPSDADTWDRKELALFVGSEGALKPKKKKQEPPKVAEAPKATAATTSAAPAVTVAEPPKAAQADALKGASPPAVAAPEAAGFETPAWNKERHAITMPVRVHCEDTTPNGHVRLESLVAFGERIRSLSLKQIMNKTLADLKAQKLAILASEYVVEIVGSGFTVLDTLRIDTTPEFPAAPLFPWETNMFCEDGKLYMKGLFGLNLCSISDDGRYAGVDQAGYKTFVDELRKWSNPGKQRFSSTNLRFFNAYEPANKPFTPQGCRKVTYVVRASDCDMYNVLFQARVASMMQSCHPRYDVMAMYVNLISSVRPGDRLNVFVLFTKDTPQDTALFLCTIENASEDGAPAHEVALTAFGHYGSSWPMGREEIKCASVPGNLIKLLDFVRRGVRKSTNDFDLSTCELGFDSQSGGI